MQIEIPIDFNTAQASSTFKAAPEGTYELRVKNIDLKHCGSDSKYPGRPRLNWVLEIVNSTPEGGGQYGSIFYSTLLPWRDGSGQLDTSNIGFLVDITKALGAPWQGNALDTNEYIGLTCTAQLSVKTGRDDTPQNDVKKFL